MTSETTPPTDDVRKALAELLMSERDAVGFRNSRDIGSDELADAVLAAFEVRPYGTVTDTDVEQQCFYCKGMFPHPVSLHHSEDDCAREAR